MQKRDSSLAYHMTAHLRMNGVYWGLDALELMNAGQELERSAIVQFVVSCWDDKTGSVGRRYRAHMQAGSDHTPRTTRTS